VAGPVYSVRDRPTLAYGNADVSACDSSL
jgi:hypothetical protein